MQNHRCFLFHHLNLLKTISNWFASFLLFFRTFYTKDNLCRNEVDHNSVTRYKIRSLVMVIDADQVWVTKIYETLKLSVVVYGQIFIIR